MVDSNLLVYPKRITRFKILPTQSLAYTNTNIIIICPVYSASCLLLLFFFLFFFHPNTECVIFFSSVFLSWTFFCVFVVFYVPYIVNLIVWTPIYMHIRVLVNSVSFFLSFVFVLVFFSLFVRIWRWQKNTHFSFVLNVVGGVT